MRNTADVTGGKSIAVLFQSILGVSAINLLVAFYNVHGGKREVLFFYFVPDTTREIIIKKVQTFKRYQLFLANAMIRQVHYIIRLVIVVVPRR
jgi:hypothetical protein